MNTLWKGIMHLNAKAFCLTTIVVTIAVTLYCGFKITTPPVAVQYGSEKILDLSPTWEITLLDFVSNQLSSGSLIIPVDPFRPTIEAIFTNAAERAAFIAALKKAQEEATGAAPAKGEKKKDPFAHLRNKADVPGQTLGPGGKPMITPILTYMGFIKRPDGTKAAMFYDSANKTTIFYDEGNAVHGVDIVGADLKSANLRLDDGSTRTLKLGEKVSLAPEEAKAAPKKPADGKPGAGKPEVGKPAPKNQPPNKAKLNPAQKEAQAAKRKAQQAQGNPKKQNFADRK